MNLFDFVPGYETNVYDAGKEPLLFAVIAFLLTFVCVRLYTRLGRIRGWGSGNIGGVHIHHVVPGVVLMVIAGLVALSQWSRNDIVYELAGIVFGVGAALVLDEFALVFHLKDVYWREEGRASVDAMIIGASVSALVLVSASPFGVNTSESAPVVFAVIFVNASFALATFLKRKWFLGSVAILVPFVGIVAGIRLAKPDSPWARVFYDPDRVGPRGRGPRQRKLMRSRRRFGPRGRLSRFERWFKNLVGGAPHLPATATDEVATDDAWWTDDLSHHAGELSLSMSDYRRPFRVTVILVLLWAQVVVAVVVGFVLLLNRNDPTLLLELGWTSQAVVAASLGLIIFGLATAFTAVGLDNGSNWARWLIGVVSVVHILVSAYLLASSDPWARPIGVTTATISLAVLLILFVSRTGRDYFASDLAVAEPLTGNEQPTRAAPPRVRQIGDLEID